MKFPLLNTFQVDESIVSFLNRKFEQYSSSNSLVFPSKTNDPVYVSETGVHTKNMCLWDDDEYRNFLDNTLLEMCSKELELDKDKIDIHFTHFFDYRKGGLVNVHNHSAYEDYVMFIYTNTCSSGNTVFYLNWEHKSRTKVKLKPTSGLAALFSSSLFHEAEYTSEPKRIFVVGIKINLWK